MILAVAAHLTMIAFFFISGCVYMYPPSARFLPCVSGWLRRLPLLDFISHGWLSTFEVGCGVLPDVDPDMLPLFILEKPVRSPVQPLLPCFFA